VCVFIPTVSSRRKVATEVHDEEVENVMHKIELAEVADISKTSVQEKERSRNRLGWGLVWFGRFVPDADGRTANVNVSVREFFERYGEILDDDDGATGEVNNNLQRDKHCSGGLPE